MGHATPGKHEQELREMRERRFKERNKPSPDQLREQIAKVPATTGKKKPKPAKKGKRR